MDIGTNKAISAYSNAAKIGGVGGPQLPTTDGSDEASGSGGTDFADLVGHSLLKAIETQYKGEATSTKALAGQADLHELVTAVSNAELTLNTVVAIRDRVINAYHDIIKMPI